MYEQVTFCPTKVQLWEEKSCTVKGEIMRFVPDEESPYSGEGIVYLLQRGDNKAHGSDAKILHIEVPSDEPIYEILSILRPGLIVKIQKTPGESPVCFVYPV